MPGAWRSRAEVAIGPFIRLIPRLKLALTWPIARSIPRCQHRDISRMGDDGGGSIRLSGGSPDFRPMADEARCV
jgi:hypothetical protein